MGRRPQRKGRLLYFHLAAGIFKFLFRGVSLSLVGAFQHRLGRAFDQGLGFRQAPGRP